MFGKEKVQELLNRSGYSWRKAKKGWRTTTKPVLHVTFDESLGWVVWLQEDALYTATSDIHELYEYIEERLISINEQRYIYTEEEAFDVKWETLKSYIRHFKTFKSTKAIRRKDVYLYEVSFLTDHEGTSKLLIGYSHTFSYWVLDQVFHQKPFYANEEYAIGEFLSKMHYLINQWNQKNMYKTNIFC